MKYFKNQIYKLLQYPSNNADPSIHNDFKKNFKISDTDMSLLIKTDSNFRFEQIKHYCIVLLSNILKNIGDIIDYLKQNIKPNNTISLRKLIKQTKYNLSDKLHNLHINTKTYYGSIDQFKGIVHSIKRQILEHNGDITYDDIKKYFHRSSQLVINDDPNKIKYSCNPVENILIVDILDFVLLHKDINIHAASKATIIKFRDNCIKVNKYLNYQLLDKVKLLFTNYDNFKTELATALYNNIMLNDDVNEVYDFDSEPHIKYLINKNMFVLEPDRAATNINTLQGLLDFNPNRNDYMMAHNKNVSSNRLQIKFNNPKQNYVSHNNTINLLKNNNLSIFSLIRLKHLITIKDFLIPVNNDNQPLPVLKLLNIPSELLDISIVHPYDYGNTYISDRSYSKLKYCIPIYKTPTQTHIISYIPSSNLENLIYDLQYVLFISSMFPFHDPKYEKRIFRLLYFIKLNANAYGHADDRIYITNYDMICNLMNRYTVTNHDNSYTLTKRDDNIGIINTIIKHFSLNISNYNISLYKLFRIHTNYIAFTELYKVIILFSELIITNTNESKLLLYNICKYNYNSHKIINDYMINDNIDGFYTDFTQKFILFIKTIKDKLEIINSHPLFRQP